MFFHFCFFDFYKVIKNSYNHKKKDMKNRILTIIVDKLLIT